MITTLIERWRQETHTFYLPIDETTITLQDVEVLWDLGFDGLPVTLIDQNRSVAQKKDLIQELLENRHFKDGRLKLVPILEFLYEPLPDDAPEELIHQHVRCYILILFGGHLFADTYGNLVRCHWLDFIRDIEGMSRYSWGSATLACLYSRMCKASHASTSCTAGPYMLL